MEWNGISVVQHFCFFVFISNERMHLLEGHIKIVNKLVYAILRGIRLNIFHLMKKRKFPRNAAIEAKENQILQLSLNLVNSF